MVASAGGNISEQPQGEDGRPVYSGREKWFPYWNVSKKIQAVGSFLDKKCLIYDLKAGKDVRRK